jgi:hypothetical protein
VNLLPGGGLVFAQPTYEEQLALASWRANTARPGILSEELVVIAYEVQAIAPM